MTAPLATEPDIGSGEPLAAIHGTMLVARPSGRAVKLAVLRCVAPGDPRLPSAAPAPRAAPGPPERATASALSAQPSALSAQSGDRDRRHFEQARCRFELGHLGAEASHHGVIVKPRRLWRDDDRPAEHRLLDPFEHERVVNPADAALDVRERGARVAAPRR